VREIILGKRAFVEKLRCKAFDPRLDLSDIFMWVKSSGRSHCHGESEFFLMGQSVEVAIPIVSSSLGYSTTPSRVWHLVQIEFEYLCF
jgi:hypothetical protein